MINPAELGRLMMKTAAQIDDDVEFNRWAKLGPKLISMGATAGPRSFKDLSIEEQQVMARAIAKIGATNIRAA